MLVNGSVHVQFLVSNMYLFAKMTVIGRVIKANIWYVTAIHEHIFLKANYCIFLFHYLICIRNLYKGVNAH